MSRNRVYQNTKDFLGFDCGGGGESWLRADNTDSGIVIEKAYMGEELALGPKHARMLADKLREWARSNERAEKAKKARRK